MRLKYEFSIMDMGDEYAAVSVGDDADKFHGMLKLNKVSADILNQLQNETDTVQVQNYLKEQYPDSSEDEIKKLLTDFINQLVKEGLLIL